MKKLIMLACLAAAISLTSGTALADSIKGRVGLTGKLGFLVPADNEAEFSRGRGNNTDVGLIGGGGLIYGIDNNWAAEFDVTGASFDSDFGDFGVTNLSLGGQYRFRVPENLRLVPYAGAGLDILISDFEPDDGTSRDVDTSLGVHLSGGVDYFVSKELSLGAEAKLVLAPDADITAGGRRSGDFDPTSFSSTVGIRYFFN